MLALNGLFILVTRHGLEYPAFYRRLYGLLTLDAFQVLVSEHIWEDLRMMFLLAALSSRPPLAVRCVPW